MKEEDDKKVKINRLEGRLEELEELHNSILKQADISDSVNFELAKFEGVNQLSQIIINKVDSAILSINTSDNDLQAQIMHAAGHLIEIRNIAFESLGNQKGVVEKIVGIHETLKTMSDDIQERGRSVQDKMVDLDWEKL
jgi:Na+/phosphate symporter